MGFLWSRDKGENGCRGKGVAQLIKSRYSWRDTVVCQPISLHAKTQQHTKNMSTADSVV